MFYSSFRIVLQSWPPPLFIFFSFSRSFEIQLIRHSVHYLNMSRDLRQVAKAQDNGIRKNRRLKCRHIGFSRSVIVYCR